MDHLTYEGSNQKIIERFMLVMYSIYGLGMMAIANERQWADWISLVILVGGGISWGLHIANYKTYSFRSKFTAIMMQVSVVLYMMHVEDINKTLPVFATFLVFMGLYGNAEIIYVTVFSAAFIFGYHGLILMSMPFGTVDEIISAVARIANVFLLEYVVYVWTKRNSEGSRQLLGVIDELKEVESSKDDFLANVSHEIRTPINTICGMSEIVLQEELPDNIKGSLLDIQLAGRNLMSIVSDILDFSELMSGKMEVEEEAYNITSTINDVINMTLADKNAKKLELIVDCNANIPSGLLGDEKKIRRVIMNLVDNAIKFTEEGCVSVAVGYRKETYGINLIITVKDTGIGMSEESLEKLFASFSQVDSSRKRQEGGLGLGLAISNALVHKMGGAMTMRSKLGKGTIVQFVVPQKVLDERPIASIQNREEVNVAVYIDMEQFDVAAIRDEYTKNIIHMVEELRRKCHICRSFAELQRREKNELFTHIFISIVEYKADMKYFDELALRRNVIVVLDRFDEVYISNPYILKIYKPFYILTIVSVLNGLSDTQDSRYLARESKFTTKDVHLLAVDDNRMNLRVLEGLLKDYNIKVTMANSGKEALEKIVAANYDFVFMDHMMPEMDGVETLQRIRRMVGTYYQKVPIIALTANAVAGTREMLIGEGFTDFVEKPIERSVFERVLKRNLPPEKLIYYTPDNVVSSSEVKSSEENSFTANPSTENAIETASKDFDSLLMEEGIDVEKGILYCGGRESYISVLQGYCEECEASGMQAKQLFEKKEWKDYTIAVHGLKSAMRSIGAMELSDIAANLEKAGKEGQIDYIMEHHALLIKEYQRLFTNLCKIPQLAPDKKEDSYGEQKDVSELPVLEDAVFDRILSDMEDAMYDLDGESLMELVKELQKYEYCETTLSEVLVPVVRKIEMSDYISAVEMVAQLKNKLAGKE